MKIQKAVILIAALWPCLTLWSQNHEAQDSVPIRVVEPQRGTVIPSLDLSELEIHVFTLRTAQISGDTNFIWANQSMDLGRALCRDGRIAGFQYGPAGTACLIRLGGLSPNHTSLTYQGIPLNSLTLGQADFSLLPTFFFDGFFSQGTMESTYSGSPGIGGGVVIESLNKRPGGGVKYWTEGNSLNNFSQGLGVKESAQWKGMKVHYSAKAVHNHYSNRFFYKDNTRLQAPLTEQTNNDGEQNAGMAQMDIEGQKGTLEIMHWSVKRDMQLPNRMGQEEAQLWQFQSDLQHRSKLEWTRKDRDIRGYQWGWKMGNFLWNDAQTYTQRYLFVADAVSSTASTQNMTYWQGTLNNGLFRTELRADHRWVKVVYNDNQQIVRNIPTLFLSHHRAISRGDFLWSTKVFGQLSNWGAQGWNQQYTWEASCQMSRRNYESCWVTQVFMRQRMPDFNELYWPGSGNVNLKQETAKGMKSVWTHSFTKARLWQGDFSSVISWDYTYRLVDQWIQWVPMPNGLWQPQNWKSVIGQESNVLAKNTWKYSQHNVQLNGGCEWLDNRAWKMGEGQGVSQSLPYAPRWRYQFELGYGHTSGWQVQWRFKHIGWRYTNETEDLSMALPAVHLMDCSLQYVFKSSAYHWTLGWGCDNLGNVFYQEIAGYALPGRVWNIQMNIEIK
jgi:iron complex outermembrane receptor protein